MSYPSFKPSDRVSRKQVAIYMDVDLNALVRAKAARAGIPLQEVLAAAMNLGLAEHGLAPVLNPLRLKVFRRVNRPAAERTSIKSSRNGKYALSAWYDRKEVQALKAASESLGMSTQDIGAEGIRLWLLAEV